MSQPIELEAEPRTDVGKGASRRLRRLTEMVPGIIYGGDTEPGSLTFKYNELANAMQQESFFSQIIDIKMDGTIQQAVVRDVQRHPANDRVQHIDFLRISADRLLEVNIPIHFINEDICVGVRTQGGQISHNMSEVEISCLPGNLPAYLEVDMAAVEIGGAVHLSDIMLPEGVTILALQHDDDAQIGSVEEVREMEEELEPEEGEVSAEAAGEEAEEDEGAAEEGSDDDED